MDDNREDGSVILICVTNDTTITWLKDVEQIGSGDTKKNTWNLGSSTKDPRGIYKCEGSNNQSKSLQIYYRSKYPLWFAYVKLSSTGCSGELLVWGGYRHRC